MKFGKELLQAAQACESIVHLDCWIDYKVLKKMLKHNPMEDDPANSPTTSQKERILKSDVERRFFSALQIELNKVDFRYKELKQKAMEMAHSFLFQSAFRTSNKHNAAPVDTLRACADIHLYLLVVKNYGVMNYCGFKKILKKHDKLRGVTTKDNYMVKVVNNKSFAHFEEFRTLLKLLEEHYVVLSSCTPLTLNTVLFETQRKELETISEQGNCQLKLLVSSAMRHNNVGGEQREAAAAPTDFLNPGTNSSINVAKRPRLIPPYARTGEFYL